MANVKLRQDSIQLVSHENDQAPTWRKTTKKEDIEGWLLHHKKKYHQKVYDDNSPHLIGAILR